MQEWLKLALSSPVVRRALGYAVVVGSLLIAINQGDSLLRGEFDAAHGLKMGLTVLVPYMVSTLSSVQAMIEHRRSAAECARPASGAEANDVAE